MYMSPVSGPDISSGGEPVIEPKRVSTEGDPQRSAFAAVLAKTTSKTEPSTNSSSTPMQVAKEGQTKKIMAEAGSKQEAKETQEEASKETEPTPEEAPKEAESKPTREEAEKMLTDEMNKGLFQMQMREDRKQRMAMKKAIKGDDEG